MARHHAAPGGRAVATGLTVSATFGIVAALAAHQPVHTVTSVDTSAGTAPASTQPTGTTAVAPPTAAAPPVSPAPPRTTIVTRVVHRTIEVDEKGTPLAPPATPTSGGRSSAPVTEAPAPPVDTTPPPPVTNPPATVPPPPPTTAKPTCSGSKC
jgi:hypothetical protein